MIARTASSASARGIPIILEMGTYCRLDCVLGTSGLIRASLSQAMHHASHRAAFGKRGHGGQTVETAATGKAEQKRFRLIVAMMFMLRGMMMVFVPHGIPSLSEAGVGATIKAAHTIQMQRDLQNIPLPGI